ncbi:MAG: hypothetical protein K2L87_03925 [Clostridiales bacterium]|nr:hypothetical protein [Clostridiales bacterium]
MKRKTVTAGFAVIIATLTGVGAVGCNDSEAPHTHVYGEYVQEIAPTCTAEGVKGHFTCKDGDSFVDIEKNEIEDIRIPALGHDYSFVDQVNATTLASGVKAHFECTKCNLFFDENKQEVTQGSLVIPPITPHTHVYGEYVEEVAATCTADGMKGHFTCTENDSFVDLNHNELSSILIPALGHDYSFVEEIAATELATGVKAHYTCTRCPLLFDTDKAETTEEALVLAQLEHRHSFTDGKCACGEYEDSAAGENAKYIDGLEGAVMKYISSASFKGNLVSSTTSARVPLMYLKYVSGSLFSAAQMEQITGYLDMIHTLQDDNGYIQDVLWDESAAQTQGWNSIIDYCFSWSEMYSQYLQYAHANDLTDKYASDKTSVLHYVKSLNYWWQNPIPEKHFRLMGTDQPNVTIQGWVTKTINFTNGPIRRLARGLAGEGGSGGVSTWLPNLRDGILSLDEFFPEKHDLGMAWCDRVEREASNWDEEANGPIAQKVNWNWTYNPIVDDWYNAFYEIYCPTVSGAFCFGGYDLALLTAYNLGADIDEYASYPKAHALSWYEKDEDGNYKNDSSTPNWIGFTGRPLVATVLHGEEGFDVDYEKSVQYYFPDHDTGMSAVKPEERVTLDRLATDESLMNIEMTGGSSASPQCMLLTAMAMGIDLEHYVSTTGVEANLIEFWLKSLIKDGDGNYTVSTIDDAAMMIAYICQLKGIDAPSPMGLWNETLGVIG